MSLRSTPSKVTKGVPSAQVQGLSQFEKHEIGDVHQVVLGVDARGTQAVLHPLGRGGYLAVFYGHARIAGRRLVVLDADFHAEVVVVRGESRHVGHLHRNIFPPAAQIGRQVARHADVRRGIHTVGREPHLDQVVVLDAEVVPGRRTRHGIGGKLHDPVVRGSDAQFVLGTEHAERLHAADLAAFDLEFLVAAAGVEHRAHRGAEHFQPRAAVGGAADDLQRLARADVDRGDMQVVGIGMILTGEHLAHHHARKAALDGLDLLKALDLESDVGQYPGNLFGPEIGVDVAFEPVIRNIHIVEFEN